MSPGSVQGDHELTAQALPERVRCNQRLELGNDVGVASPGEIDGESLLECRKAELFETRDRSLREGLVHEVRQRRASKLGESLVERGGGPFDLT